MVDSSSVWMRSISCCICWAMRCRLRHAHRRCLLVRCVGGQSAGCADRLQRDDGQSTSRDVDQVVGEDPAGLGASRSSGAVGGGDLDVRDDATDADLASDALRRSRPRSGRACARRRLAGSPAPPGTRGSRSTPSRAMGRQVVISCLTAGWRLSRSTTSGQAATSRSRLNSRRHGEGRGYGPGGGRRLVASVGSGGVVGRQVRVRTVGVGVAVAAASSVRPPSAATAGSRWRRRPAWPRAARPATPRRYR